MHSRCEEADNRTPERRQTGGTDVSGRGDKHTQSSLEHRGIFQTLLHGYFISEVGIFEAGPDSEFRASFKSFPIFENQEVISLTINVLLFDKAHPSHYQQYSRSECVEYYNTCENLSGTSEGIFL